MAELHLLRPLWLLALVPLAGVLWHLARRRSGEDVWRGLVDPHLLPHLLDGNDGTGRSVPWLLLGVGGTLAILALAGPAWERMPRPVYQAETWRVIVLDISAAMNAPDLAPSRLARARFEVLDLLARSGEGQSALIAYGAEPYLVSPLTADARTIAAQVPDLDSALLPVSGQARADLALGQAGLLLRQAGASRGEVILVTGTLDQPAGALEAARTLAIAGHRVSVLGVGTPEGAPVPLAEGGFLKDAGGAILLPRLDRGALSRLAAAGGGRYLDARPDDADAAVLIPETGAAGEGRAAVDDARADLWRDQGPLLLLPLLALAALAFRRGWLGPLALLFLVTPPPPAQAFGWADLWQRPDQQGARALAQDRPAEAAARFADPAWRAAAHYRAGDYENTLADLAGREGARADYNRGNSLARLGRLDEALAAYERALAARPEDEDARHNRDLVKGLLDQRQGQPPDDPSGQDGDQGGQDQSGGDQGERGQGDRNPTSKDQGATDQGATDQGGGESSPREGGGQDETAPDQGGEGQDRQDEKQDGGDQSGKDADRQTRVAAGESPPMADRKGEGAAAPAVPTEDPGPAPGLADLLGEERGAMGTHAGAPTESTPAEREERQSAELLLRRVPDDPSGLLRQRFLLQHLRRQGRLP